VKPPCIEECPVNLECTVLDIITVGDHDLILGTVVAMHIDADKLDKNGQIRYDALDPLIYFTGEYWSAGKRIAMHGFTAEGR
jgi:flavin reductase (DIM6/NTAB) family NADH-FMN oxidoreductase RutF